MMARRLIFTACAALLAAASALSASPAHAVFKGSASTSTDGAVSILNAPGERSANEPVHVCTGALISPRWVVTAKHCVQGYAFSAVRAGDVRRTQGVSVPVVRAIAAPTGDVGLVQLAVDAPGPYLPWSAKRPSVGATAVTRGFGATVSAGGGDASAVLKQVTSKVSRFEKDPEYGGELVEHAFSDGETRSGDSGGPMTVDGVLVGPHSGLFNGLGGASSLASVASWVQQTTGVAPVSAARSGAVAAPPSPVAEPTSSATSMVEPEPAAVAPTSTPQVPVLPQVAAKAPSRMPTRASTSAGLPMPTGSTQASSSPWWMQVETWFKSKLGW